MYKCEMCGVEFDRPLTKTGYEPRPDCFYERFKEVLCPVCGQPYFNEIEEDYDDRKNPDD
ncbi:MAG: hypothetical protein MR790_03855 [Clostridiales bacterium]|nr:hypothetical protein [Clostridiales bacterium]